MSQFDVLTVGNAIVDIIAHCEDGFLEENGIITRRVVPTSPPSVEYELTELGGELLPAIRAIAEVGMKLKQKNGKDAA